ncbi:MAG: helix-turn-helix transcriptional regulator [Humibacter sp.]
MDNRTEVREFLISRRARITPEKAGIDPVGTRRRVAGLRRDEVARLAGVSVDYYTRLERGNLSGVSDSVLDAIARALQLDRAEHDHLYDLARAAAATSRTPPKPRISTVQPPLQYLLDSITGAPAFVVNNREDIVAYNALGHAMYIDMFRSSFGPANYARFIFLDPHARDFYADWERSASTNVAMLRRQAGRFPHDKGLAELIGELSMRSDEFRTRWAAHNVHRHYTGTKHFNHPIVGPLELLFVQTELDEDTGLTLTVYPAVPGSPTDEALRLLASWAATEDTAEREAEPA